MNVQGRFANRPDGIVMKKLFPILLILAAAMFAYAPVMILIMIASLLFSVLVASGQTAFPGWMAWINPVTMTISWLILKRILPQFVRDWTEGAGFNIAYLVFFACTTITLWNG